MRVPGVTLRFLLLALIFGLGLSTSPSREVRSQPDGVSMAAAFRVSSSLATAVHFTGAQIDDAVMGRAPCCGYPPRPAPDAIAFSSDYGAGLAIHIAGAGPPEDSSIFPWRAY